MKIQLPDEDIAFLHDLLTYSANNDSCKSVRLESARLADVIQFQVVAVKRIQMMVN